MKTVITLTFLCFCVSIFGQIQSVYDDFDDGFRQSDISFSGNIGDKYLFIEDNGNRHDIMVSDGTAQGTKRLDETQKWYIIFFNNRLYYQKFVSGRRQMHVTDGTADNTFLFLDSIDNERFIYSSSDYLFFMKDNQL
jgi:hypothetical protein